MGEVKKISLLVPTYNEEDNIYDGYVRLTTIMKNKLSQYDYEIVYIDNCSQDGTRVGLRELAASDPKVKVILNGNNFGWMRSSYYGLINTTGDCTVLLAADMQEPPEMIEQFAEEWEKGAKVVVGVKTKSRENPIKYFMRDVYYRFINRVTEINHIDQFMGFGLYDKEFVNVLKSLDDPIPYFRGIVAELGFRIKRVEYTQDIRKKGKTHFNFYRVYDLAMLGITSYSKSVLRIATMAGVGVTFLSLLVGIVVAVLKLCNIIVNPIGMIEIFVGLFILGGIQLIFIGLLGEYILNINIRTMKRPLVVEEERINF